MKPNDLDYQIDPAEGLEIHALTTGPYPLDVEKTLAQIAALGLNPNDHRANMSSIAWWHNHGPALALRLMEAEKAILQMYDQTLSAERAIVEMDELADRITKGRKNHD